MKKNKIKELEAEADLLRDRMDYLVNSVNLHAHYTDAEYYWDKFERLLTWATKFDPNSDEYAKIVETGWNMLGKFLECLVLVGGKNGKA